MSDVDKIIAIRKLLQNIWEADEVPAQAPLEPAASPEPAVSPEPAATPVDQQPEIDQDIEDVMTTPRASSPDDDEITKIGDDLGLADVAEFVKAFDAMRSGAGATEIDSTVLADAFDRLMTADTSTVQKTINRLRDIYDRPIGSSNA